MSHVSLHEHIFLQNRSSWVIPREKFMELCFCLCSSHQTGEDLALFEFKSDDRCGAATLCCRSNLIKTHPHSHDEADKMSFSSSNLRTFCLFTHYCCFQGLYNTFKIFSGLFWSGRLRIGATLLGVSSCHLTVFL